jgi:hypothetical protein
MLTSEIFGKGILVLASLMAIVAWVMNIWGDWAERTYERTKGSATVWYWFRKFNVPMTQENCTKFIKSISSVGLALILLFWAVGLLRLFNSSW